MAESLTLPVIFGLVGAGFAIAALTGGGFKLIVVELPTLDRPKQIGAGVLAAIFVALQNLVEWSDDHAVDEVVAAQGIDHRAACHLVRRGSVAVWTVNTNAGTTTPPPGAIAAPGTTVASATTAAPTTTTPAPPSTATSKVLVIKYIDNTGYIDIDRQKTWDGDVIEPSREVDVSVNPRRVASVGVARIALSESGGKDTCQAAIEREAPKEISMGQVQDDKGFCAESQGGRIAYIRFKNLVAQDNDHFFQLELIVYR